MPADAAEISAILQAFDPSPTALLDLLRARVDDAMLQEIAECDYGFGVDENLAALRRARDFGEIPPPDWNPMEVLHLTRWIEPDAADCPPNQRGQRGHLSRAFACSLLLRMGAEFGDEYNLSADRDTLVQFVASVLALGPEPADAAARFLAWRIPLFREADWDRLPFELGLLLMLTTYPPAPARQLRPDADQLLSMANWLLTDVARMEEEFQDTAPGESLLQSELYGCLRADTWRRLIRENLLESPWPRSETLQKKLMEIGKLAMGSEPTRKHA